MVVGSMCPFIVFWVRYFFASHGLVVGFGIEIYLSLEKYQLEKEIDIEKHLRDVKNDSKVKANFQKI